MFLVEKRNVITSTCLSVSIVAKAISRRVLRWSSVNKFMFASESEFHLRMKLAASSRLSEEGFVTFLEPPFSPEGLLSWSRYRPDVLGMKRSGNGLSCCFVECETNPSPLRLGRKRVSSVNFQSQLFEYSNIGFVLMIPEGQLRRVSDPSIRRSWNIWTYGRAGGRIREYPALSMTQEN